jgi:hypothetical protein
MQLEAACSSAQSRWLENEIGTKIMCRSGSSSAVGAVQYLDIYDFVLALGAQRQIDCFIRTRSFFLFSALTSAELRVCRALKKGGGKTLALGGGVFLIQGYDL